MFTPFQPRCHQRWLILFSLDAKHVHGLPCHAHCCAAWGVLLSRPVDTLRIRVSPRSVGARWSASRFLLPSSRNQLVAQQLCFSALHIRLVVSHSAVDSRRFCCQDSAFTLALVRARL